MNFHTVAALILPRAPSGDAAILLKFILNYAIL